MFGDLSFNNNLIYVNNTSYVNGLYNTLSSYIRTTNTNLNNYQSYIYSFATSLSGNVLTYENANKNTINLINNSISTYHH